MNQTHICIDDYGNEVYIGHYTGLLIFAPDAAFFGAIIPQAKCRYVDHAIAGKEARKVSYRLFCDSEQNCNTCKYLKRLPHTKNPHYPMTGQCLCTTNELLESPFWVGEGAKILFHPDDWMGMECYVSRWAGQAKA